MTFADFFTAIIFLIEIENDVSSGANIINRFPKVLRIKSLSYYNNVMFVVGHFVKLNHESF